MAGITGVLGADFTSFLNAVAKAEVSLKGFEAGSAKVSAEMTRMANSFSGQKIIGEATMLTKVINDSGGAATLTAKEMAKVNATVTEAVAKYKALGGTAPQAMVDLADATKKIDPPITTFIGRLNQAKDGLAAFASGAKTIGMGLTASVTAPLAAVGIAAFKASTDFESAFAGVKKTVSGTPDELAKINTEFREMAKTTPTSAVGLAKIGEMAGQLGVQKSAIVGFTKTIVDISVATNLTADEAASAFARLGNVMKLPQDQFSNLGSAVVALGNFGASTEQEMLSMAQRISAAGATAGMAAPQVLGIANALSSVGIEAEAGGTAVSKVIIQMATSVANGGKQLDLFAKVAGVSSKEFQKAWRDDAGTAFSTFMQGLAKVRESGGDQLISVMDDLGFAEVRLKNAMMSAANAGDLMAQSIALGTKAFAENTELARAAEERYKTVNNQLKVLWNQVTDVAITIGDALIPTLLDLVKAGQPMIAWLSDAAKWFKELPEWVRATAIGMAALAAAVGPAVFILGSLSGAVANLIPLITALSGASALSGMGAVVGFLGNPLVLAGAVVIGGIALAVYELNKNLSALSHIPSVGKPLDGLKDARGTLIVTADAAQKAASEVGALSTGFKLTIASITPATAELAAHTGAVTLSKKELAAQAKELHEVAKAHEIVRQVSIPLTAAQQAQLKSLMDLNTAAGETIISTKTMAKEIGASETQVKVFAGGVKLAAEAAKKLAEELDKHTDAARNNEAALVGLHTAVGVLTTSELDAVKAFIKLQEAIDDVEKTALIANVGFNGMADGLEKLGTKSTELDAVKKHLDDAKNATGGWGQALSTLSKDFVDMAQIGGDAFGETARHVGLVIKAVDMAVKATEAFQKAAASVAGASASDYASMAASFVGVGIAVAQMINAYKDAKAAAFALALEQRLLLEQQTRWNTDIQFTNKVFQDWSTATGGLTTEVQELGGVANLTADQFKHLGDMMALAMVNMQDDRNRTKSMHELNALLAEMGQVALDAGKLVSQTFIDLVKQAKDLGIEVAGVNELILGQLGGAAEGVNELLIGLSKGLGDSFTVTAEQGAGLAAATAATFAEMIERGMSYKEALDKLKPSIDILTETLKKSGVDGGAAFDFLTEMARIAGDEFMGPLSDAITGANSALKGLHNSGILNQTMFTGLEQSAMLAYQKIIDGGGDSNAALMMMQPTLQTLWEMQRDFGYIVDDATQALLDEAEATGKVGDKHRPVAEQMLLATQAIERAVTALARVMGADLPLSAEEAALRMTHSFDTVNAALVGVELGVMSAADATADAAARMVDDWHAVHDAATGAAEGYSPSGIKQIGVRSQNVADIVAATTDRMVGGFDGVFASVSQIDRQMSELEQHRAIHLAIFRQEEARILAQAADPGAHELFPGFRRYIPPSLPTPPPPEAAGGPVGDTPRSITSQILLAMRGMERSVTALVTALAKVFGSDVPGASTGAFVTDRGLQHFARGGTVLNFRPRGSDTVPAMLTPGEMVLTPAQQQRLLRGGGGVDNAAVVAALGEVLAVLKDQKRDFTRSLTVALASDQVLNRRRAS